MNAKNLNISIEEVNGLHRIKILDSSTNEVLCTGSPVQRTLQLPSCLYNGLLFMALQDNTIWMNFNSVVEFINKEQEIIKEET